MNTVSCIECANPFTIYEEDRAFFRRMEMPEPQRCPQCRERRRLLQINQLHLFRSKCAATGKSIFTNCPPGTPYTIYSQQHWYSDEVDNTKHGRPFDFSKTFFEQFADLQRAVPRPALFTDYASDENSDYTNFAGRN